MTPERFDPAVPVPWWVRREHVARYHFAARYVKDAVVVDCACGAGLGAAQCVRAGARLVLAIDRDPEAASAARTRLRGSAAFVCQGDASQLPMRANCATVCVALEMIEHLEIPRAFLNEVRRILNPGGVLICSTPNRDVTNPGMTIDVKPSNPWHIREYARQELFSELATAFRTVEWYGQNPCPSAVIRGLAWLGHHHLRGVAAGLRGIMKLGWCVIYGDRWHQVRSLSSTTPCEYFVVVCRDPRC